MKSISCFISQIIIIIKTTVCSPLSHCCHRRRLHRCLHHRIYRKYSRNHFCLFFLIISFIHKLRYIWNLGLFCLVCVCSVGFYFVYSFFVSSNSSSSFFFFCCECKCAPHTNSAYLIIMNVIVSHISFLNSHSRSFARFVWFNLAS